MKPTKENFLNQGRQAITLMGMSGVGKTHWAWALSSAGWHHYNCDYLIGTKYLRDELGDAVKTDDLGALSRYIGQVGRGGLSLVEFKRRQARYIEAERQSLHDLCDIIDDAGEKIINDSTGSICEIEDEALFEKLGQHSLFVYIKAGGDEEEALVAQAMSDPKPLYFPPKQFDGWLKEYMNEKKSQAVEDVIPNDFSRWVFPKLFYSRLPKYQRLADRYGITVSSKELRVAKTADDFLKAVGLG